MYHFLYGGKFTSRGDWTHPEFTRDNTELILVTEGRFDMWVDGSAESLKAGDVFFVASGKRHRGVGVSHGRVSFYWLHFNGGDRVGKLSLRESYPAELLCRQILHYHAGGFDKGVTDSLLSVLLAEIDSQISGHDHERGLAGRVAAWIKINSDRPIEASDVSLRFGYNEDYLSRIIRKNYGIGMKSYINEKRMNHLKQRLLETELTLTEIADAAGFADYKLFLKFFRYHEGISPTEFRKTFRVGNTNNR